MVPILRSLSLALVPIVFAPAEARGLSIQGAPAWTYEHSVQREKTLVVSVSHYIAPKDVAFWRSTVSTGPA